MRPLLLSIVVLLLASCTSPTDSSRVIDGDFVHVVLFWLHDKDRDAESFETSVKKFIESSEYVQSMHLGSPAMTPREVVDNSYSYCLIVSFADKAAHDAYQAEQVHLDFIEESKDLWSRVQIFDSLNEW